MLLTRIASLLSVVTTSIALLTLQGCSGTGDESGTSQAGDTVIPSAAASEDAGAASPNDDGGPINIYYDAGDTFTGAKIVGVLHAVNQGEIQVSTLAMSRGTDPNAIALARSIVAASGTQDEGLLQVAPDVTAMPVETDISRWIETVTSEDTTTLATESGATFDVDYVRDQVAALDTALNLIATYLIPNAPNPTIMNEVVMTQRLLTSQRASLKGLVLGASTPTAVPNE